MASMPTPSQKEDRKEACKTYIEQTKLLVTLASAFVLAPIAFIGYIRNDKALSILSPAELRGLMVTEGFFVLSVLLGYVVLGALAGTQHEGAFDVFRPAIRVTSLIQFSSYLLGLGILVFLLSSWPIESTSDAPSQNPTNAPAAVP
jgi:hypothetical protein